MSTDKYTVPCCILKEIYCNIMRPPLKKSLFPVQRVAIIMAIFFNIFSPCIEMVEKMLGNKRIIGKCEKMSLPGTYRVTRPVDRKQIYF